MAHDNGTYVTLETQVISPTCRENRGQNGAWDEAVARLREIYIAQSNYWPGAHLALAISRGPIDDIEAGDPLLPPHLTFPESSETKMSTHDNGAYVTLGFADNETDANELAAEFWRAGRKAAVVRVADSEAMIGRQIKAKAKFAVVGEANAR